MNMDINAVGSHMLLIEVIMTRTKINVVITKTRSLYLKVLCVPESCLVVHCPAGHSASK